MTVSHTKQSWARVAGSFVGAQWQNMQVPLETSPLVFMASSLAYFSIMRQQNRQLRRLRNI